MALALDVETPLGLARYHTVGEQGYDINDLTGEVRRAWCVLKSYPDEAARRDPNFAEWLSTRFDYPIPGQMRVGLNQATFYNFIKANRRWADAEDC